jgi:hypothetical protein
MQEWSARQVHDTVAAIVSQPAYGAPARQSLVGRFLRYLFRRIAELFDWMGGSVDARIIVAGAVVLVALIVVARIAVDRRLAENRRRGLDVRGARGERRDYWRIAGELAASGRHADASHAVYAAVLDALTGSGMVKYHSSKTSGDYARELRRHGSPLATDFRSFAREFDRAVYGTAAVSAEDYARLRALAEPLAPPARARPAA